jgi:hypothetical protein
VAANITAIPFTLPNSWFRTPASLPAFAVSPTNGNLYVSWSDYRHGDADIYFTSSTDGGNTWEAAVRLNDDPIGNGVDQIQPQVSVAPNGRVAVMWFDRRLDCPDLPWIPGDHVGLSNFCIDTFMTRSFDDGQTWVPNIRASEQTWDWTLNLPLDGSGNGFIGDYQGIASNDYYDFPFWNATANLGDNVENYQEVFVARVPVEEVGTVHVGNIRLRSRFRDPMYSIMGLVPIYDADLNPVEGALVTAEWTKPNGRTFVQSGETRVNGTARFRLSSRQEGNYTLTVLDVQADGFIYDPDQNLETSEEILIP